MDTWRGDHENATYVHGPFQSPPRLDGVALSVYLVETDAGGIKLGTKPKIKMHANLMCLNDFRNLRQGQQSEHLQIFLDVRICHFDEVLQGRMDERLGKGNLLRTW
jgi:hypothetical protein